MTEVIKLKEDLAPLRDPILVTGFAVRRQAGRLASTALTQVIERWHAEPIAKIEPEEFLDFTVRRPNVKRTEEKTTIDWPETTIYVANPEGAVRDIVLLTGFEPNFYWHAYVDLLADYAESLGVKTLVSLRSFPGSIPHTRPAPIMINASDIELEVQFGVQSNGNRYEGPTDISGVFAAHVQQKLRWQTVDLSVLQPYYFPRLPNAAAAMAVIKVLDHAFGTTTPLGDLPETAEQQVQAIEESIASDSDTKSMVADLERRYDRGAERMDFLSDDTTEPANLPSGDVVIEEIERLLREGGSTDS